MAPLRERAYSLFELLITLTIASLVLMTGLPSLGGLVADKRLRSETDALFHAVHLARKASIVRRRVVTLCPSVDGERCTGGWNWSAGWIVFENSGSAATASREPGETILLRHAVSAASRIEANRDHFSLRATHRRATNGTLVVCDAGDRAVSRALVVSYTGRPRVAREDPRGNPYRCMN